MSVVFKVLRADRRPVPRGSDVRPPVSCGPKTKTVDQNSIPSDGELPLGDRGRVARAGRPSLAPRMVAIAQTRGICPHRPRRWLQRGFEDVVPSQQSSKQSVLQRAQP